MTVNAYGLSSCCRDCIHGHVNEIRMDRLAGAPDGSLQLPHQFFWIDRQTLLAGMVFCDAFGQHLPYPQGWQTCCRKQTAPANSE